MTWIKALLLAGFIIVLWLSCGSAPRSRCVTFVKNLAYKFDIQSDTTDLPGKRRLQTESTPSTSLEAFTSQVERKDLLSAYEELHARESLTCGRSLMFVCGSKADCGGVGDRLTGMISMLMVAILSDRVFLAHHNGLEYVFQPEKLMWRQVYSSYSPILNYTASILSNFTLYYLTASLRIYIGRRAIAKQVRRYT